AVEERKHLPRIGPRLDRSRARRAGRNVAERHEALARLRREARIVGGGAGGCGSVERAAELRNALGVPARQIDTLFGIRREVVRLLVDGADELPTPRPVATSARPT